MFNIDLGYPAFEEEERIYLHATRESVPDVRPVLGAKDILAIQKAIAHVAVSNYVVSYAAQIVRATRPHEKEAPPFVAKTVEWGAGPRAGLYLIQGARAMAAMEGRPYVSCEDIRSVAVPVLKHRISTNFQAQMEGLDSPKIVKKILETVKEPQVPKYEQRVEHPEAAVRAALKRT
jgi:MoxR-like ATPase